jgi:hypothetical protein
MSLSLTNRLGLSSSLYFAHIACYWKFFQLHRLSLSESESESESYVTTDGQSVSLSWNKAPIWGLRPDFYYCQLRVCWYRALSLTRGRVCRLELLLALASEVILGSESHWNSLPYFTLSDSRLKSVLVIWPLGKDLTETPFPTIYLLLSLDSSQMRVYHSVG